MTYQPIHIYCSSCGAPAQFDIARQTYVCQYCGGETGIHEPLEEKRGFRKLHRKTLEQARQNYPLVSCSCSGCGATVIFPEQEALTSCSFCGRSLARKEYLGVKGFPELLIPFRITVEEARARLLAWCDANPFRPEAKVLRQQIGALRGFYLPYELIKGPTRCTVKRSGSPRSWHCRGFLEGSFVNTSGQLDNLLLDGMEPYDLNALQEFDFSYLAGQRVKIRDLSDRDLEARVKDEVASCYEPFLSKTMETRAVTATPSTDALVQLSAVLPAYYLRAGDALAAVNGQTGKVAVREARDRFLLPWQVKPVFWTAVLSLVFWIAAYLLGADSGSRMIFTGCMAVFLLLTLFTAYHNLYEGERKWRLRRRVFTSDKCKQPVSPPVFYEPLDGTPREVELRFTTWPRMLKMLLLAVGIVFLPVILAFVLNGFSTVGLTLAGAAVWLCITVPIAPVYLLNFGRIRLYEHPMIWIRTPDGGKRRWRGEQDPLRSWPAMAKDLVKHPKSLLKALAILAAVILVLMVNVLLVLHWDQF